MDIIYDFVFYPIALIIIFCYDVFVFIKEKLTGYFIAVHHTHEYFMCLHCGALMEKKPTKEQKYLTKESDFETRLIK